MATHPPSQSCPSFYHVSHIHCHFLHLWASPPSLLFVQKIILFISLTQNFARKRSVNLDTLMEILLLDFPSFTGSLLYMDNIHGSWTSLLSLCFHLPTHNHHLMFSPTLTAIPTLFPVTATPLWHRCLRLHSKPFSITLSSFWVFLFNIYTINGSL